MGIIFFEFPEGDFISAAIILSAQPSPNGQIPLHFSHSEKKIAQNVCVLEKTLYLCKRNKNVEIGKC
jgi:hypothetical protein